MRALALLVAALVTLCAPGPAPRAQTACRTPNCGAAGTVPAACTGRARPRTHTVGMTGGFQFSPTQPRIEPGDCIGWDSLGLTHASNNTECPNAGSICNSPSPSSCLWETGNVAAADPVVVCHYDPATWPPVTDDAFHCRIHAAMTGVLHVTSRIELRVEKEAATGSVVLSWTGGGIPGSEVFKVHRSNAPAFPDDASFLTADPDGGAAGRTWHDAGELTTGATRYYLVRNRQTTE